MKTFLFIFLIFILAAVLTLGFMVFMFYFQKWIDREIHNKK